MHNYSSVVTYGLWMMDPAILLSQPCGLCPLVSKGHAKGSHFITR